MPSAPSGAVTRSTNAFRSPQSLLNQMDHRRRLAAALSKMSCAGGISTSGHEKICDQLVDEWLDEQRATRQIRNR